MYSKINNNKTKIRNDIKSTFQTHPFTLVQGEQIVQNIISLPQYKAANTVMAFVPTNNEVKIQNLLHKILQDNKTLALPLCLENFKMQAKKVENLSHLQKGMYGILQPSEQQQTVDKQKIDIVIIPCMSANSKGERLGKGKGYYDRFLQNTSFLKIVVCQHEYLYDNLPVNEYDILADIVVTDKEIYTIHKI